MEVLPASSAWHEVCMQSSAGVESPAQVFHRQEGAEDVTNLHQDCCAKGQTSKDEHCYHVKDLRLAKQSAKVLTRFPLLGQANKKGEDVHRAMFIRALTHTSCSAPPGREDAQIVLPHMLEHGKRHALSQHEVKSGFQEVTTCRRSRSSDDANQALSRHGSKLLPCLTTLHGLMGPAPQQCESHKRPVAWPRQRVFPVQGDYQRQFFAARQQHPHIRKEPAQAHTAKRTMRRCGCESKRRASNTKARKRNLAELNTQVVELIIRLKHYKPRSGDRDSRAKPVIKTERTSRAKDSTKAEIRLQEHEATTYASNDATMNHKESPQNHRTFTLGWNEQAQE